MVTIKYYGTACTPLVAATVCYSKCTRDILVSPSRQFTIKEIVHYQEKHKGYGGKTQTVATLEFQFTNDAEVFLRCIRFGAREHDATTDVYLSVGNRVIKEFHYRKKEGV